MGISWSYRGSASDEEEFPYSFLNRSPHFSSRPIQRNRSNSTNNRTRSSEAAGSSRWNWNNLFNMSTEENGDLAASSDTNRISVDSDHDDREGDESIANLLSQLIRSGQVRLITSENLYAADDDTMENNDAIASGNDDQRVSESGRRSKNVEYLKSSDIKTIVDLDSGQFSFCKRAATGRRNIFNRVRNRELGSSSSKSTCDFGGQLTQGDKCFINNHMLPNVMSKVDAYRSKVFCGQYTKDGRVLITACQDQRIRFYDMTKIVDSRYTRTRSSGNQFSQASNLQFHSVEAKDVGWSILDVAVSPDGRHAVYSSWSDYIHQCGIYDDQDSNHMAFHLNSGEYRFCIFSLRFSADGNEILAGASDRCLYVYDRQGNTRTLKIEAHEDDVNSVCFADETSQIIYSGGDDGLCKVWDRRTLSEENPKPVGILAGHTGGITFIDSKCDSRHLISNSKDQSIKLWDVRKFSTNDGLRATKAAVSKFQWDYRWQNVPRNVRQYHRLEGDTSVMTYRDHHTVLHTLIRCFFSPAFTTGQRYVYTGCASGSCVVYDLLTGELVKKLKGHKACVRDVSWHPYRNEICTASWDAVVARWTFFDGGDDPDFEDDVSRSSDSDDMSDTEAREERMMGATAGQTAAGRLTRLYRRRQVPPLRRSERLREQQRRRMMPSRF